jgi:hypothetical protein
MIVTGWWNGPVPEGTSYTHYFGASEETDFLLKSFWDMRSGLSPTRGLQPRLRAS